MDTSDTSNAPRYKRWRHTPEFKAQVIADCLQHGVSIAAIALTNQLNANQLRTWVKAHRNQHRAMELAAGAARMMDTAAANPVLVPVTLQAPTPQPPGDIQIEIRRRKNVIHIICPTSQSAACADWLREVLR